MITAEILEAASQLEIRARHRMSSLLEGSYRTAFRGSSMQFKEFRPYEPGDDIRHMSWTVTARTGRPTVKIFEQERELDVILMVDTSGSSLLGGSRKRKIDMYAEVAAMIGLSAIDAGDNFGLMLFNESVTSYLPAAHRRDQVRTALTQLLGETPRGKKADISVAVEFAARMLPHRSLTMILSDFWVPAFEEALTAAARRHEFILLNGFEDEERGQGLNGLHELTDPETGDIYLLDGRSPKTRQKLQTVFVDHLAHVEGIAERTRSGCLSLSVEDDYVQRLVLYFERRGPVRL
ncbi:MAG: DUF58 domain-containing protein [Deltaproteobacteria bacterium]|nr:DUF58 domain-containing protein [Deltaproteobacteria bacterium]MBI3295082.1 DUF58 domain-containing protein [Deltaproteobacteria bacterium]